MTDILAIIAGGSPDAARIAIDAIRARQNNSPMAQARTIRAARAALQDPMATFTPAERQQIGYLLDSDRDSVIRLRVTEDEKARVQARSDAEGVTVSEYIRRRIGL